MIGSLSKKELSSALGRDTSSGDLGGLAEVVNHNARALDKELTRIGNEITMTNLVIKLICDELDLDIAALIEEANEKYKAQSAQPVDHGDHPGEATVFGGS